MESKLIECGKMLGGWIKIYKIAEETPADVSSLH